jgi:hypothetical protein
MSDLLRDWYAATAAGALTAGEVVYSWRELMRPAGMVDDTGAWHRLPDPEAGVVKYDGPRPDLFADGRSTTFEPGPGGVVVRRPDGSISADRESAGGQLDSLRAGAAGWKQLADTLAAMMGSGRRPEARKGSSPADVARALAWESLRLRMGPREAARTLIVWDAELSIPGYDAGAAALVCARRAGQKSSSIEQEQRRTAERGLIRSAHRVLVKLGIEDARRIC